MTAATSLPPATAFEVILDQLLMSGLLRGGRLLAPAEAADWRRQRDVVVAVRGVLRCGQTEVPVRIGLPSEFPARLPEIAIDDDRLLPLPHAEEDGRLCYDRDANLADRADLYGVLAECVERAADVLAVTLASNHAVEFAEEIAAYWEPLARFAIHAVVAATDDPHRTKAIFRTGRLIAVADEPAEYARSLPSRSYAHLSLENAVYVPVAPGDYPNFEPQHLLDARFLRQLVSSLMADNSALPRLLSTRGKRRELVILGVKRQRGERALIALELSGPGLLHPLAGGACTAIAPISLRRRDHHYLLERGGADRRRSTARVLLVGCGAVGGHLAAGLARAGVGSLDLVDADVFTIENSMRHLVGMAYEGVPKAVGLQSHLQSCTPFVRVGAYPQRFADFLKQRPDRVGEYDLVVCATGHPTTDLVINERVWAHPDGPPTMFVWLEPLGIGGHALVARVPADDGGLLPGCFECLHHHRVQGGPLVNEAAFADSGGDYTRDLLGCGASFLPFGDADAVRTANLATRLSLDVLDGTRTAPALASWKGPWAEFRKAGFRVTKRYERAGAEDLQASFARPDCPICGALR